MQRSTFLGSLLVTALVTTSPLSGQSSGSSSSTSQPRLFVMVYHPKTSPIYVPTWTLHTDDLLGSIVIQNHSTKAIRSVDFTWIADTPTACLAWGGAPTQRFGRLAERDLHLPPDRAVRVNALGLNRNDMLIMAASSGRLLIDVEVVPSKVVFEDGTVWRSKASFRSPYDHGRVHALAENCVGGALVPVEKLLQARGTKPECSPAFVATSAVATQKPQLKLKRVRLDDFIDECELDGDCGGGGDGSGGDMIFMGGIGGGGGADPGDPQQTTTPAPTPAPGAPSSGWTCAANVSGHTYCAVSGPSNTCTNGYCGTGAACASQLCSAITQ